MLPQIDADPEGDLVLSIGSKEQQPIRVSSKVLKLASPVFAALLSPRFAEGCVLPEADTSKSTISTIPFPEDDCVAMVWIFHALHHNQDPITGRLAFSLFKAIAVLCDKYDLSRALYAWTYYWLDRCGPPAVAHSSSLEMLWVLCALNLESAFWIESRFLFLNSQRLNYWTWAVSSGN